MKKNVRKIVLSLLVCSLLIVGCNRADSGNTSESSNTETTKPTSEDNTTENNSEGTTTEGDTTENSSSDETTSENGTTENTTTEQVTTETPSTEEATTASSITGDNDGFGTLYTKADLQAMANDLIVYGPGSSVDEFNRPYSSINYQSKYGSYDAYFIVPEEEKNIYFTFDLGYEYNNNTNRILDILKEKNVKAVFFPTLSFVKNNPETIQRIIDEGHELGSHSTNHYSMPTVELDVMRDELMIIHDYVLEHYGVKMHLFRPPQGHFSYRSLALTQSLGYKTVIWSFAYKDYDTANQPAYDEALAKATNAAHPGALYLLHAVSNTNVDILPALIDNLRAQGYTIKLFQ